MSGVWKTARGADADRQRFPAACGRLYKEESQHELTAYCLRLTAILMFRKTLTILSLIGLLLSVGAWGASYLYPISYDSDSCLVSNCAGAYVVDCYDEGEGSNEGSHVFEWDDYHKPANFGYGSWSRPLFRRYNSGEDWSCFVVVPHWIPILILSSLFGIFYLPLRRRRKRKKLGLCVKCGYDLRASKDRCPECGTKFPNQCDTQSP